MVSDPGVNCFRCGKAIGFFHDFFREMNYKWWNFYIKKGKNDKGTP
jgi:DNA-directed RNA polymerase subunit N (RpoN/RPB10)